MDKKNKFRAKRFVLRFQGKQIHAYHNVDLEVDYADGTFTVSVQLPSEGDN